MASQLSESGVRDLLNHICTFLQYLQYNNTVTALLEERAAKRQALNSSVVTARVQTRDARDRLRAEMLRKFDEGRRDDFFSLWQQYVPAAQLGFDFATQKLEFHMQVYFAIYPVLPSSSVLVATPGSGRLSAHRSSSRHEMAQRMKAFKSYLEGRGAGLAHTAEFLPYYALPYVPQPEHHPSFEALFSARWVEEQRLALRAFLEAVAAKTHADVPLLYVMYEEHLNATDGVPRLSPRSKAVRASARAHSREGGPRSASGGGSSGRTSANVSPDKPRGAGAAAGGGGSSSGGGGGGSAMRSRAGLPPRSSQSPPGCAVRKAAAAAAGKGRASGGAASSDEEDDGFIRNDDEADDEGATVAAAAAGKGAVSKMEGGGGIGGGKPAEKGKLARSGVGGVRGSVADGEGDYGEDSFDAEDEAEMAEALMSPASAANGTTTNRNNNHNPTHQQQHPNRHSRRADADPAGLSLSQLGLPETAVLRDSVQLTLESSAGGDGQMAAQVATFGAMAMMKGAAGQQGPAAAGGGGFVGGLAPLDYRRVKEDLRGPDAALAARLLQALRWRLTRSRRGADRWQLLASWVEADLLELGAAEAGTGGGSLLQVLAAHADPRVSHETARLCNAIASDRMGRNYLMLPGGGAVHSLATVLKRAAEEPPHGAATAGGAAGAGDSCGGSRDGPAVVQSLAALQKLSLRRAAQSQMIGQGLVAWLVSYMQDLDSLSPATVEYGSALLMNLCLRSAGRAAAAQPAVASPLLALCESQLGGSPNDQVRTYVHGTLYSVLRRVAVRHVALARGTPDLLAAVAHTAPPPFDAQLNHILQLLRPEPGAPPPPCLDPSDDPERDHSDDEAAPDGDIDDDFDGGEGDDGGAGGGGGGAADPFADVDITPEVLPREPGVACGEELLCGGGYLAGSEEARVHVGAVRSSLAAAAAAMSAAGVGRGTLRGSMMLLQSLRASAVGGSLQGMTEGSAGAHQPQRHRPGPNLPSMVEEEGTGTPTSARPPPHPHPHPHPHLHHTEGSTAVHGSGPGGGALVSTGAGPGCGSRPGTGTVMLERRSSFTGGGAGGARPPPAVGSGGGGGLTATPLAPRPPSQSGGPGPSRPHTGAGGGGGSRPASPAAARLRDGVAAAASFDRSRTSSPAPPHPGAAATPPPPGWRRRSSNGGGAAADGSLTALARAASATGSPLARSPSTTGRVGGVPTGHDRSPGAAAAAAVAAAGTGPSGGEGGGQGSPAAPDEDPAAAQPRVRMGPPRKQEMHGPVDELKAFAVKRELPRTPAGHDQ